MKLAQTCEAIAERLDEYLEGKLEPAHGETIKDHLLTCPGCREQVRRSEEVRGMLKGAFSRQADPALSDTSKRLREIGTGQVPSIPYEEEEDVQPAPAGFLDALSARFGAAPWWIVSGTFHALLILMLFLIGMAIMQSKKHETVIVTSLEKKQEVEPPKEPEREIFKQPVPVESPEVTQVQAPVVVHEEVEVSDHTETDDQMDSHDAFGDEGISDIPLGGSGFSGAIGVGGGGAGAFGRPTGGGSRLRRAMAGGGNKATESAVDAALAWLARHQEPDGHWDYKKYGGGGKVWDDGSEEGITALALLAFLGAGHTEKIGKFKDHVKRATQWILAKQLADGGWGSPKNRNGQEYEKYDVALCTLAMSEAFAMARNPVVRDAAQKGVNWILGDQDYDDGTWHHGPHKSTSLIGWNIMALKSAKVAGIGADPACFEKALAALERVSERAPAGAAGDPDASWQDGKQWGKVRYSPAAAHYAHKGETMTAVGMVCFQFMGRGDETRYQAELTAQLLPAWPPSADRSGPPQTSYHWYYATLGLFQNGGEPWKRWNEALKNALVPNQRKGGPLDGSLQDVDGSWDPDDVWCKIGGRVYQTAMCALCLEVYYRYLPMYR